MHQPIKILRDQFPTKHPMEAKDNSVGFLSALCTPHTNLLFSATCCVPGIASRMNNLVIPVQIVIFWASFVFSAGWWFLKPVLATRSGIACVVGVLLVVMIFNQVGISFNFVLSFKTKPMVTIHSTLIFANIGDRCIVWLTLDSPQYTPLCVTILCNPSYNSRALVIYGPFPPRLQISQMHTIFNPIELL